MVTREKRGGGDELEFKLVMAQPSRAEMDKQGLTVQPRAHPRPVIMACEGDEPGQGPLRAHGIQGLRDNGPARAGSLERALRAHRNPRLRDNGLQGRRAWKRASASHGMRNHCCVPETSTALQTSYTSVKIERKMCVHLSECPAVTRAGGHTAIPIVVHCQLTGAQQPFHHRSLYRQHF